MSMMEVRCEVWIHPFLEEGCLPKPSNQNKNLFENMLSDFHESSCSAFYTAAIVH